MGGINGWWFHFLENYIYSVPEPPPRRRTKPMEVLCVGLPRTGTESLQTALLQLGYDHTHHGWDIVFEQPNRAAQWVKLSRKKWFGPLDGNVEITTADFDALLGHCAAVTDAAGSVFAAELIAAYPDAKVILNYRKDIDAWHKSATNTLARANSHWIYFFMSWLCTEGFWAWHVYVRVMWPAVFRALDGNIETGAARNGKWVYREHCNMIRGLVPKDRLLEWCVDDGWKPLCEFLGKPEPTTAFPHVNTAAGFIGREQQLAKRSMMSVLRNVAILLTTTIAVLAIYSKYI